MTWNGAIYCTPVVPASHMVSARYTLVYMPGGCFRASGTTW
jgi:hypothetical protein